MTMSLEEKYSKDYEALKRQQLFLRAELAELRAENERLKQLYQAAKGAYEAEQITLVGRSLKIEELEAELARKRKK